MDKFKIKLFVKDGRIMMYEFLSDLSAEEITEKAAKTLNNGMTLNIQKTNGEHTAIFPVGFRELTVKKVD